MFSIAIASADNAVKDKTSMGQGIIEEEESETKPASAEDEVKALFPVTFQTIFYQGMMLLVSLYFGMLFTNWGYAIVDDAIDGQSDNAYFSLWIKISA